MNDYDDDWERGFPIKPKSITTSVDKALLDFSVNNEDLDRLESLINAFNPIKVLGASDYEIRHSNVLAWLIDPNSHHGLGDTFFKNILLEILRSGTENGFPIIKAGLPLIEDVISSDFNDLQVLREWGNIDIFAISPSNNLLFVIENKVGASESDDQLTKYVDIVEKKYPDRPDRKDKRVFVFLTIDGTAPSGSNKYIPFTHKQIHKIVRSTVEIRKDYINAKVYDFIKQYLLILEEKTMQNEGFISLCEKLYQEHKDAIEVILEHGKPRLTSEHIKTFHNNTSTTSKHMDRATVKKYYTFIPAGWDGIVPDNNIYKDDKYLVFLRFNFSEYEKHKITLSLMIGNFPDQEERKNFIQKVNEEEAGVSPKFPLTTETKTSTTVFSKTVLLKEDNAEDNDFVKYAAVTEKLTEAYKDFVKQREFKVVDKVVKDFGFNDAGK